MTLFRTVLERYLFNRKLFSLSSFIPFYPFSKSLSNSTSNDDDNSQELIHPCCMHALEKDATYSNHQIQNIIFDLGDVLFKWTASSPESPISSTTLKEILRSAVWFDYERGNISEAEAYEKVADQFNLSRNDVSRAFQVARDSLRSDPEMLDIVRGLKASGKAVFAMSNISAPDWEVLQTKADPADWALFNKVFISAEVHERKPNVGFYKHVFTVLGIDPKQTIFVDDKFENVLVAQSFGVHSIVFDNVNNLVRHLKILCENPVERAWYFLHSRNKQLVSTTSEGTTLSENFSQLLILEATADYSLVDIVEHPKFFNFFKGDGVLTTEQFPNDLDTTSIGLTVLTHINSQTKHEVMDEMLRFRNEDGLVQVYFDHSRPRIDPVVCLNVLAFFYTNGRGHELDATLDWVEQVLIHRAYISGTVYYKTAEAFLFFLARLMEYAPPVRHRFKEVFAERITERFGTEGNTIALAMRIIAAASIGLFDRLDFERLLSMQQADGSWAQGWYLKYGSSGITIRNDGLTTTLAIKAINLCSQILEERHVA